MNRILAIATLATLAGTFDACSSSKSGPMDGGGPDGPASSNDAGGSAATDGSQWFDSDTDATEDAAEDGSQGNSWIDAHAAEDSSVDTETAAEDSRFDVGVDAESTSGTGIDAADEGAAAAPATSCLATGPGRTNCGPSGTESCCTSLEVPGGAYYRTYDPVTDAGAAILTADGGASGLADPTTVSGFRLDEYDVTVGRFRGFVSAWHNGDPTGYRPPVGSGKHTHLNDGNGRRCRRATRRGGCPRTTRASPRRTRTLPGARTPRRGPRWPAATRIYRSIASGGGTRTHSAFGMGDSYRARQSGSTRLREGTNNVSTHGLDGSWDRQSIRCLRMLLLSDCIGILRRRGGQYGTRGVAHEGGRAMGSGRVGWKRLSVDPRLVRRIHSVQRLRSCYRTALCAQPLSLAFRQLPPIRTLRGARFDSDAPYLIPSLRGAGLPESRGVGFGFRCARSP